MKNKNWQTCNLLNIRNAVVSLVNLNVNCSIIRTADRALVHYQTKHMAYYLKSIFLKGFLAYSGYI